MTVIIAALYVYGEIVRRNPVQRLLESVVLDWRSRIGLFIRIYPVIPTEKVSNPKSPNYKTQNDEN
mgnify:CR=1 FL=1